MCSQNYRIVSHEPQIGRRRFLQWGAIGVLSAAVPDRGLAAVRKLWTPERSLCFYNTHTGEDLDVVYWARGKYRKEALEAVDHILRDHRTGERKAIDPRLLDLVCALGEKLNARRPFHVISGYRSARTNALLRAKGTGVASKSLHLQGKALDIRLPGCNLSVLRRAAMELKEGGVGYYPGPDFVHIDVGRIRYW
jgi:uncharacterized protein YcbK (DUF882 family)